MLFLIKSLSNVGKNWFTQGLAKNVNPRPPAWPVDDDLLRTWQEELAGWEEADPDYFLDTYHVDVDRATALVLFRRGGYPPPPRWTEETPRSAFEQWRDRVCADCFRENRQEIFELVCDLADSVPHPVVDGTDLGTAPADSVLTRMILFKYSTVPTQKIYLTRYPDDPDAVPPGNQEHRCATVNGRTYTRRDLLQRIRLLDDGSVDLRLDP